MFSRTRKTLLAILAGATLTFSSMALVSCGREGGFFSHVHTYDTDNVCKECNERLNYTEGLKYKLIDDSYYEVAGIGAGIGNIVIPYYFNNLPVMGIATKAFYECDKLSAITIPNSVVSIGDNAFYHCSGLSSIVLPDSVVEIGISAFNGCSNLKKVTLSKSMYMMSYEMFSNCTTLTEITIPESIISIGDSVFSDCISLKSINIPDHVIDIGYYTFSGCTNLSNIKVSENNSCYSSEKGSLFNKDKTWLIRCPSTISEFTFPDTTYQANDNAFDSCVNLTSVTIPKGMTKIPSKQFADCINLQEFKVDNGNPVYYSDNGVILDKNKTSVLSCPQGKESYTVPNGIINIKTNAFQNCSKLKNIVISNSVTNIEDNAFNGCSSLTSVSIPNSVVNIGKQIFNNCSSLTSVSFPIGIKDISIGMFYKCSSLTTIVIPDSVNTICQSAFAGCTKLESVIIPNSVNAIQGYAFSECGSLKTIFIPKSVTTIEAQAFNLCSKVTINCEATSKPKGWQEYWNLKNPIITWSKEYCPVVWGVNK